MGAWFNNVRGTRCHNKSTANPDAPVISGLTVFGGGGGMAPHPIHVRANVLDGEGSTTGTGGDWWIDGRFQVKFLKENLSDLDNADQEQMEMVNPITGGLIYSDQRYVMSPHASFMFPSPGTYKVGMRYQNKLKVWSEWVYTDVITVMANTRTKRYVNDAAGGGSDSNDGLTALTPYLTLGRAYQDVNSNDWEIIVADDSTVDLGVSVGLTLYSGIWIHRSGDGAAKPIVNNDVSDGVFRIGSRSVVDGFDVAYDGVTLRYIASIGSDAINLAFLNIEFDETEAFLEMASGTNPHGVLFFKCLQKALTNRYVIFASGFIAFSVLGCDFQFGSLTEHVIRLTSGDTGETKLGSVDFCNLSMNGATAKTVLRCYVNKFFGSYCTRYDGGVVSLGDADVRPSINYEYFDYCFDGCDFDFVTPSLMLISFVEDLHRCVLRACFLKKIGTALSNPLLSFTGRSGGGAGSLTGLRFLSCSFFVSNGGSYARTLYDNGVATSDIIVRGCMSGHVPTDFVGESSVARWSSYGTSTTFEDLVFRAHETNRGRGFQDLDDYSFYDTDDEANAEAWCDGALEESHDFDLATAEPQGVGTGWLTKARTMVGVFRSFNGVEISTLSAGPSGAYHPEA